MKTILNPPIEIQTITVRPLEKKKSRQPKNISMRIIILKA